MLTLTARLNANVDYHDRIIAFSEIKFSTDFSRVISTTFVVDLDECAISVCGGQNSCNNTVGGYDCQCHKGYREEFGSCHGT